MTLSFIASCERRSRRHDAGGKSNAYAAWSGLKWRYFGDSIPPVPASVGGMRVSLTKPLLDLCDKLCTKALVPTKYPDLVSQLLEFGVLGDRLGISQDPDVQRREAAEEKLFKNILQSDGRKAKERVHEFLLRGHDREKASPKGMTTGSRRYWG